MFEKDMHFGILLDFYGDILTERQREMLECYYNNDMSLSEISDSVGISRQGVRSSVKKATDILTDMEEKLGLASRFGEIQKLVTDISGELTALKATLSDADAVNKVDHIIVQLNQLNEI
ncbi:MAG: hypothetical protein J6D21_04750 [Clostridia bacterium]|nr:hypothetical protein [Clostridia bacterium]